MSTVMHEAIPDTHFVVTESESEAAHLERRWFAASKQAEALRIDCQILREMMEVARANWRDAESRLAEMEALRDALGEAYTTNWGLTVEA